MNQLTRLKVGDEIKVGKPGDIHEHPGWVPSDEGLIETNAIVVKLYESTMRPGSIIVDAVPVGKNRNEPYIHCLNSTWCIPILRR